MKVQYLLNFSQINAIHTLTGISGTISIAPDDVKLVEYDISEEQKSMLDSILSQNGSVIKEVTSWPSFGDEYFFISDQCCVMRETNEGCFEDDARQALGNMFKTRKEAEFELERLKVLNQLKSLSDDDQKWDNINYHYHIVYDSYYNEFNVYSYSSLRLLQEYWFKSAESAVNAINIIGEDKLKKYVFNVKE